MIDDLVQVLAMHHKEPYILSVDGIVMCIGYDITTDVLAHPHIFKARTIHLNYHPSAMLFSQLKNAGVTEIVYNVINETHDEIKAEIAKKNDNSGLIRAVRIGAFSSEEHAYYALCDTEDELESHPDFNSWVTDAYLVKIGLDTPAAMLNAKAREDMRGFKMAYRNAVVRQGEATAIVAVYTPKQAEELRIAHTFIKWLDDWKEVTV